MNPAIDPAPEPPEESFDRMDAAIAAALVVLVVALGRFTWLYILWATEP